jgi:hypothetical protein
MYIFTGINNEILKEDITFVCITAYGGFFFRFEIKYVSEIVNMEIICNMIYNIYTYETDTEGRFFDVDTNPELCDMFHKTDINDIKGWFEYGQFPLSEEEVEYMKEFLSFKEMENKNGKMFN